MKNRVATNPNNIYPNNPRTKTMHPAEQALIARDPALPGLALLLDDRALSAALRPHLRRNSIDRVTYRR